MITGMVSRPYKQRRRAEQRLETRQRIVDALVALHGEIGPAHTTISAIAERAGVQRLTIYRHFADEAAMFEACSAHYATQVPPPDAGAWEQLADPLERLRSALLAFYDYYARAEQMLTHVLRDAYQIPPLAAVLKPWEAFVLAVRDDLSAAFAPPQERRASLTAWIGHALRFETWVSLIRAGGLEAAEAADTMVTVAKMLGYSSAESQSCYRPNDSDLVTAQPGWSAD